MLLKDINFKNNYIITNIIYKNEIEEDELNLQGIYVNAHFKRFKIKTNIKSIIINIDDNNIFISNDLSQRIEVKIYEK